MEELATVSSRPVASLGTGLHRARCTRPALVGQMAASLQKHGQLTPMVAVERGGKLELIDGFKRHAAALQLGLTTLLVRVAALDETSQWAAMLALNQGPARMTELEEALIIREIVKAGLTQLQVAQLVGRHKSWVSRRMGLVERLHPELVEGMRLGILHPGVARRLLGLPPGNQLQVATAAQTARLGPRDTELLVSLWQRAKDAEIRKQLLAQPAAALKVAFPELVRAAPDPRLTPGGQQLRWLLPQLAGLAAKVARQLPPSRQDLHLLAPYLARARQEISRLASALGPAASGASASASDAAGAPGSSSS
ncbi:MAG TPA: ParB N-terminal domain-containing protein [Anaerolineae bacterium]|nr:ParB N-terminal domain-containing protein [Anaerolineae bacterium]